MLGYNFAAHLNARMGWGGGPLAGGLPIQDQQQQQQQQQLQPHIYPAPPHGPLMGMGIGMGFGMGMPQSQALFSPSTAPGVAMGMGLPQRQMPGATGVGGIGAASGGGIGGVGGVFGSGAGLLMSPVGGAGLMPAAARTGASTGTPAEALLPKLGGSLLRAGGGAGATLLPAGRSAKAGGAVAAASLAAAPSAAAAGAAATTKGKKRRRPDRSAEDADKKAQDQIVRRRERNRVLARQTRMRKKFFYQSLKTQMAGLRSQNRMLKTILMERLGARAKQVVYDCTSELSRQVVAGSIEGIDDEEMDEITGNGGTGGGHLGDGEQGGGARTGEERDKGGAAGKGDDVRKLTKADYRLVRSLQTAQQNFVVTEPSLPDNPIVFASDGFLKLTGYTSEEVIGRNCRFLQGPDTDREAVATIRQAIDNGEDASVCFLNYKADGTPFWNQFFVAALRDEHNRVVNYVGSQCPVSAPLPTQRTKVTSAKTVVVAAAAAAAEGEGGVDVAAYRARGRGSGVGNGDEMGVGGGGSNGCSGCSAFRDGGSGEGGAGEDEAGDGGEEVGGGRRQAGDVEGGRNGDMASADAPAGPYVGLGTPGVIDRSDDVDCDSSGDATTAPLGDVIFPL
ncbi:unnamed protein product [Scytosiphon promiscuus]